MKIKRKVYQLNIYIIIIILGISSILFGVFPCIIENTLSPIISSDSFNNIMLGLGTGLITSAVATYLIEKSNLRIKENENRIIKENIVYELNSYVKYILEEKELMIFEKIMNENNLFDIINKCENCLILGITFYNKNELDILQNLHGSSKTIKRHIEECQIRKLYNQYENLFKYSILENKNFNPFIIENQLKESIEIRKNIIRINQQDLYEIAVFHSACINYIFLLEQFCEIFRFIKKD